MFGVAWIDPEYVGVTIAVLWGIVVIGGALGLALQSANPQGGLGAFGRLLTGAAVLVLLPAITLSCTAALS